MVTTKFEERLKTAMSSAGLYTPEDLSRRCLRANKPRLTVERVREVMADPEHAMLCDIADVSEILNVRVMWLTRGWGIASPPAVRTPPESTVLQILAGLSARKAQFWVGVGRRLLER